MLFLILPRSDVHIAPYSVMASQREKVIGFKTVQLFKDETLGIGSYGAVCRAKCDDLLCAAKILHPALVTTQEREHRRPITRFQQEYEFLSTIRHPNIVQFLGVYRDPDTCLPVLIMEMMDDNLTHFVESSGPQPIPYHIQVSICHDITQALSYLHSSSIIHRDLSSNNVLMAGTIRAKVADFGMARLKDENPQATHHMCPGTDVYMPPEAVKDNPVYTEKIDCFSFGVLVVQIMTRLFPQPGDRRKEIEIEHVGVVEKQISEQERRQNHISKIDPNHPLLATALDCLKDKDVERPSAEELCRCIASLKQNHKYRESMMLGEQHSCEIARRVESLQQQHAQQIKGLQQIIRSQVVRLEEKDQTIMQKNETIAAGQQEIQQLREQHRDLMHKQQKQQSNEIAQIVELLVQQHAQEIESLQEIIQLQVVDLKEKDQAIKEKDQMIMQKEETIAARVQEIHWLKEQLRERAKYIDNRKLLKILANEKTQLYEHLSENLQGDNEETDGNQTSSANQNKKHRKKFGAYPPYRIRLNGVKWISCESSDEEGCSRNVSPGEFRGSRKLMLESYKYKNPKPTKRNSSSSCNEENDEESEPHVTLAKRQKKLTKLRPGDYDFNSTTSEASDVESLTDCSLGCNDN